MEMFSQLQLGSLETSLYKTICIQKKDHFRKHFSPIQHSVSTEGDTEILVYHIQLKLKSNKDWVVVKSDVENAFNLLERRHMLNQLLSSFRIYTGM